MALLDYIGKRSLLQAMDPRTRLLLGLALAVLLACCHEPRVLAAATGAALVAAFLLRIPGLTLLRRLRRVLALVALTLPAMLLASRSAGWSSTAETAQVATLRLAAIVLTGTCLISTIPNVALGAALTRLRIPARLAGLAFITVRCAEILRLDFEQQSRSRRVRSPRAPFTPARLLAGITRTGLLLVRCVDRTDRNLAAMKCRGFRGEFHTLQQDGFGRADAWFALGSLLVLLLLAYGEWR